MSVDILSFNTSLTKAYSLAATVTRQKIEIEKKVCTRIPEVKNTTGTKETNNFNNTL